MFEGYENVTTLRTREDARTLRGALMPGARVLVIGAGFIGQETASSAMTAGAHATIIEAASTPLESVLGNEIGRWFADLHRSNGVELLLEQRVVGVGGDRLVDSVTLVDGRTIHCDHVVLGVGVDPDVGWLSSSPLGASRVCTDVDGRTEIPGIYAAGDVAAVFDPLLERHVAGDHWESAGRQGSRAAKAMLGLDSGPLGVSSFWSDLYGTRVQYLGHASLADELSIDGDPQTRAFTATFTREDQAVAVLLVGRPQMLPQARRLLSATTEVAYA
jgi:NADPH-dependent 2,4-dienoyl-CoA reductase/sulfur reductase-like enzyme